MWPLVAENSETAVKFHQSIASPEGPDLQNLERLVVVSIANFVRQDFAAAVVRFFRKNPEEIRRGWRGTRTNINDGIVQVTVDTQCFYATNKEENFYVNASATPCRAVLPR
jgi:hypothetical protein